MKIAFIGGWGHHCLRQLVKEPPEQLSLAVAGDGLDAVAAHKVADGLPQAKWFDDASRMLDEFRPDAVSVGAVYAHNGRWIEEALRRGLPTVSDKPVAASWESRRTLRMVETIRALRFSSCSGSTPRSA